MAEVEEVYDIDVFISKKLEELKNPVPWVVVRLLLGLAFKSTIRFWYEGARVFVVPGSRVSTEFAPYLDEVGPINYYNFTLLTVRYFGERYLAFVDAPLSPEEADGLREKIIEKLSRRGE